MVKAKAKKVRVTWRDAVSHSEWLDPNTAKTFKPYINVTEGFLLEKNKNATIIYMSYNDTDIGDTCVIPSEKHFLCRNKEISSLQQYLSI